MSGIGEFLENPTISKITRQEKNEYQMSHINIMDLLKRIELLEKENKKSELEFKQEISANKKEINFLKIKNENFENEIKILKSTCLNLERQIENKAKSEVVLKQEITTNKNEINKPKASCTELEKRIQKNEASKQSTSAVVQKTTIAVNEQKKTVKVGEIIKFGKYKGKDIEWQVLDVNQKDNSALLISKYLLFKEAYNDNRIGCTWETSTLRKYLNNEFYRNSFNDEEKKRIKEEVVKDPDNKRYGTKGGNDTKDKVFLLSIDEINKYFKTDKDRKATLTDGESRMYWLRSPGDDTFSAACVFSDGLVYGNGFFVDYDFLGVRSALWINL